MYQFGDIVDLDDIEIAESARDAWALHAQAAVQMLAIMGRVLDSTQIPDEQGVWLPDGSLEIFVEISGVTRISMKVPPGHWRFVQKK